ncbi:DUF6083 domain-containing protein [Streptomyces sp. NPDC048636]|uniref:DUF6083 domain-containing protein n=1 Tax=Streptomyces sp. NPDC048636 TaxID=3155762 RepID=UPI00343B1672
MIADGGSGGFNWDGSPRNPDALSWKPRTLRLHASSASKALRADNASRCLYCHHRIEWFDRFGGGRIPLLPKEFSSRAVPDRCRWSVVNGLAYIGDGGRDRCRIAHPTMCPAVEHEDNDPALEGARRAHATRTRKWIDEGAFIPAAKGPGDEEEVTDQRVPTQVSDVRHVMFYLHTLWIAPTTIYALRCVARAHSSGSRCKNPVFNSDIREGYWDQRDIPVPPGRAGQETLWAGRQMWVYNLSGLETGEMQRWLGQRCSSHGPSSPAPDDTPPEWNQFNTWRHAKFILYERPAGVPESQSPLSALWKPQEPTTCAGTGCNNGRLGAVEEGWLCRRCKPVHAKRERTHKKWQQPKD